MVNESRRGSQVDNWVARRVFPTWLGVPYDGLFEMSLVVSHTFILRLIELEEVMFTLTAAVGSSVDTGLGGTLCELSREHGWNLEMMSRILPSPLPQTLVVEELEGREDFDNYLSSLTAVSAKSPEEFVVSLSRSIYLRSSLIYRALAQTQGEFSNRNLFKAAGSVAFNYGRMAELAEAETAFLLGQGKLSQKSALEILSII